MKKSTERLFAKTQDDRFTHLIEVPEVQKSGQSAEAYRTPARQSTGRWIHTLDRGI